MPSTVPPARARAETAWRQPRSACAAQWRWARQCQATSLPFGMCEERRPLDPFGMPTQRAHAGDRDHATHRALPARLPSYADCILRLQDTESLDHVAPSARRITTRRRLAGGVRRTGDQRPSVRGARSPPKARPLRPLATRDQYDSPATFHSTRTPPTNRTHHHGRAAAQARRSTPRSTSSSTSLKPRDTNPPSTGVRPSPAGRPAATHAAQLRSALPVRMLQAHAHEAARARDVRSHACPTP